LVRPSAIDIVNKLAWHFDEPFADSSAVPTYYVSKVAREHVTVALGGDGGDESFAGYRRYVFDHFENLLRRRVPGWMRRTVFGPLGQWYPPLASAPRVFRAKATFQSLSRTPLEGYFNSLSIFRPDDKHRLLTPDFRRKLAGYESLFRSDEGIFDMKFLKKIWEQHQSGHYDRSSHLWSILMFRKWQETFAA